MSANFSLQFGPLLVSLRNYSIISKISGAPKKTSVAGRGVFRSGSDSYFNHVKLVTFGVPLGQYFNFHQKMFTFYNNSNLLPSTLTYYLQL